MYVKYSANVLVEKKAEISWDYKNRPWGLKINISRARVCLIPGLIKGRSTLYILGQVKFLYNFHNIYGTVSMKKTKPKTKQNILPYLPIFF